jgi:hypothetical protein
MPIAVVDVVHNSPFYIDLIANTVRLIDCLL